MGDGRYVDTALTSTPGSQTIEWPVRRQVPFGPSAMAPRVDRQARPPWASPVKARLWRRRHL